MLRVVNDVFRNVCCKIKYIMVSVTSCVVFLLHFIWNARRLHCWGCYCAHACQRDIILLSQSVFCSLWRRASGTLWDRKSKYAWIEYCKFFKILKYLFGLIVTSSCLFYFLAFFLPFFSVTTDADRKWGNRRDWCATEVHAWNQINWIAA